MARSIEDAVKDVCLWFPETTQTPSRGSPNFRVRNKTFAIYSVNHHGDGRIALLLRSPPGAQQTMLKADPAHFYVPPYVGPSGWLGVLLDQGLDWNDIAQHVRDAYLQVAPRTLGATLGATPAIKPPTTTVDPALLDPFSLPHTKRAMEGVRRLCVALPEVSEDKQFGSPAWRAGKKCFCTLTYWRAQLKLSVWVGADAQAMLTFEDRYRIPAYTGHNGWIDLRMDEHTDWREVEGLLRVSYEHFALKRMLQVLDAQGSLMRPAANAKTKAETANKSKVPRTSKAQAIKRTGSVVKRDNANTRTRTPPRRTAKRPVKRG